MAKIQEETCPLCRAPQHISLTDQIEGLLQPRSNGLMPGLHQAIVLMLLDWWKKGKPTLAQRVVVTPSWQAVALDEPFKVAAARLCRGSEYAEPCALGLAILAVLEVNTEDARTLRISAIQLDTWPCQAREFLFKHEHRLSKATKGVFAHQLLYVCPEAGILLAKFCHDFFQVALLQSVSARLGSSDSATRCIQALVLADEPLPHGVCLRTTIHSAAFEYGSKYASVWLADESEDENDCIRYLEHAIECGDTRSAYKLGILLEKKSHTCAAISAFTIALSVEKAYFKADIHFRLARLGSFSLGAAECHLREAVKGGHQEAALVLGNICQRGVRHNLEEAKLAQSAYATAELLGADAQLAKQAKELKRRLPLFPF